MKKTTTRILIFCLMLSFLLDLQFTKSAYAEELHISEPAQTYSYEMMTSDIVKLSAAYPDFIEYRSIGKTIYGRDIWAVKLGHGDASVLINGSHHAREWLTTNLVMYMLDQYARSYSSGASFEGYDVKQVLDKTSIWFVPMVNPDGVTLAQEGLSAFPGEAHQYLLNMNGGSYDFDRWKANAQGIDLNRQYPADWENIRGNVSGRSFKNHKGYSPLEANEAKALAAFTYAIDPEVEVAYHSSGEILYWNFHNKPQNLERDRQMMQHIAALTGYDPVKPQSNPSGGGFTDWFIQQFGRPGFTPEIGAYAGETSLPVSAFNGIWEKNKAVGLYVADQGYDLWYAKYPVETVDLRLTLLDSYSLYDRPASDSSSWSTVALQPVHADRRLGNWYRIDTWLGKKWIYNEHAVIGDVEKVDMQIELLQPASMRWSPFEDQPVVGEISPQKLSATAKWGEWYKINSWLGQLWIKLQS